MPFIFFLIVSIVVFGGLIAALTLLLLWAEARLARKGQARIFINDNPEPLAVSRGGNLLMALAQKEIYLPSACGGKGTCGVCTCQVISGGGDVLATETPFLTRGQRQNHYRLSCQVKIRDDLKIRLPEEIFNIKKYSCRVVSSRYVATFIKELTLELAEPMAFKAGQYVQVDVPVYKMGFAAWDIPQNYVSDWESYRWRELTAENDEPIFKGYSIANPPTENRVLKLNVRIALPPLENLGLPPGVASSFLFALKEGDPVSVSGPFGEFTIKETKSEMIYLGGGAGMAPLRSHLLHLLRTLKVRDRTISFWYGARSKKEIFYEEEFRALEKESENFHFHSGLSAPLAQDQWQGPTGFIHQIVYDRYLKDHPRPEEAQYYLCGPPAMIEASRQMLDNLGVAPENIAFDSFG